MTVFTNVVSTVCVRCLFVIISKESVLLLKEGMWGHAAPEHLSSVMSCSFGIQSSCSHQDSKQCMHGVDTERQGLHIYTKLSTGSATAICMCCSAVRSSPMCGMHLGYKITHNIHALQYCVIFITITCEMSQDPGSGFESSDAAESIALADSAAIGQMNACAQCSPEPQLESYLCTEESLPLFGGGPSMFPQLGSHTCGQSQLRI